MKERALSLDALRGYAILTMILSGQMILTHLPAWMAHAQVPPGRGFDPSIYGITWVDLVFPFFLFSMGAAFPFSAGNKIATGEKKIKLCWDSILRCFQLVFFAIFFQHMIPWVISSPTDTQAYLLTLLGFALMFPMFMHIDIPKLKGTKYAWMGSWGIKLCAFVAGFVLMNSLSFGGKKTPEFDPEFSNIILLVLANMALFGTIIYVFTYRKPIYRIAVLPFVMAVFLAGSNDGWVKELFNYSPVSWIYKFYYLKYLFIVLIGSIAGEYLHEWVAERKKLAAISYGKKDNVQAYLMAVLSLTLIVCNVIFLFTRQLQLNLGVTIGVLIVAYFILKIQANDFSAFWKKLFVAGAYCLMLGLVLEAYEGGIRKDSSTYSYYFVTSGLAFFALLFFSVVCDYFKCVKSTRFLVMSGQNPMIAYAATSLFVIPVLNLTHISNFFDVFNEGAFMGFLRGLIVTSLTVLVTMFFTRIKWFWRT